MSAAKNLTGMDFGMLHVLRRAHSDKHYGWYYWCKCLCNGKRSLVVVRGCNLTTGHTTSCGCKNHYITDSVKSKKQQSSRGFVEDYGCGY